MNLTPFRRRGPVAALCIVALLSGTIPVPAATLSPERASSERVLALMNAQSCAVHEARAFERDRERAADPVGSVYVAQFELPSPSPSASASASPSASPSAAAIPTPSFPPAGGGTTTLYATPRPQPGSETTTIETPPPVPTATPNPFDQNQPVFVQRGGSTPPPITPAGAAPPTPEPQPTGLPTLPPNSIAILADKVSGNTNQGEPGDAEGNVHILYGAEEIVGDRAHYDGLRTVTITGHPFIVNHARDSVLEAQKITFDTIDQTARLDGAAGTSSEGVERGLVHYTGKDLYTDPDGVGHGTAPNVTTCEHERGGYHITGKNFVVYPGDKIVIYQAILWLGAAAVFFLPKVVIPLRTIDNEAQRPKYFPDIGYDQYEGYWIKTRTTFGRDQYYYGYYILNYFTKVGLGLGYVGYFARRSGHRSANVNFYTIHDRRVQTTNNNVQISETENFSQTLRGNFGLTYQSNYGPYTNLPANTAFNGTVAHNSLHTSQTYGFSRSSVGSQSSNDTISFTDNRQFSSTLSNAVQFNLATSQSTFAGIGSSNSTAHFNDLFHYTTGGADYQMTVDKTYAKTPYGINKLPELQIRPYKFFPHLWVPATATFTAGEYSEPANAFSSQRADLAFAFGPLIENVFGSNFQSTVNVTQYAYGTGDMKAAIQQQATLTSPIGHHIVNTLSYSEANYNGPAFVPFQFLDQQPIANTKNAQDLVRVFNGNTYNLSLGFQSNFNAQALPVSYQLIAQPSARSMVLLGGSFIPGIGQGFNSTNLQLTTPFGRNTALQFVTDLDWKQKGRMENKIIYLTRTIGDCYQLQALYNQSMKLVTVSINILAFPSHNATFNVGQSGPLIPTTFNF
ncbi:MAG: hypothetical protein KGN02_10255 [bacterium]|nr:hypothetical protein [bacterium]